MAVLSDDDESGDEKIDVRFDEYDELDGDGDYDVREGQIDIGSDGAYQITD